MTKINQALTNLFEQHRIVFWYDANRELRSEYETLAIPDVVKIELADNEYGVKYRVLRDEPEQKFLLYHEGPQPDDLDHWLLDVQLAQGTFQADQISLWMSEMGLRPDMWEVVQAHSEFFRAAARRQSLKKRLASDDSQNSVRIKMLAACVNGDTDARLESILEVLLAELAEGAEEKINLIQRCGLDEFLWKQMQNHFGYASDSPGMQDFAITLFKACYAISLEEPADLSQDALVFLKDLKNDRRYYQAFETLSANSVEILNIERDLQNRDFLSLIEIDMFEMIDQKILSDLVQAVVERTISAGDCEKLIWRRRNMHWFDRYSSIYEAINIAAHLFTELENVDLRMETLADGIQKYVNQWCNLDQMYRKFIYNVGVSNQHTLLQRLIEKVENQYTNQYLLKLNDNWQQVVDHSSVWDAAPVTSQRSFYDLVVKSYLDNKSKVAVVISDGLRYEIGRELSQQIERENRYSSQIEAMLTVLPSYTQTGMAALLPHRDMAIMPGGTVEVDGQSTSGRENRAKILAQAVSGGATALRAEDLLALDRENSRELFRNHQVVYIYHNQIDAAGDKMETEGRVFTVAENAMQEILEIIKKLANANFSNILITSDHGFIYQNRQLDESEFAAMDVQGDEVYIRNRRFVIGRGLHSGSSVKHYQAGELGYSGEFEIIIPKSINRLRLQGSGSRYVHGGAALQEVVIPVIKIHKKRTSDVALVEVDVITSSSSVITSGQLSVSFYQSEAVSAKLQGRTLRAGIYSREGDLISDTHELRFDLTSENPREREVRVRFILGRKADGVNNQTVYLKLEEPVTGTSHYREYKSFPYQLRRSFTTDFDF